MKKIEARVFFFYYFYPFPMACSYVYKADIHKTRGEHLFLIHLALQWSLNDCPSIKIEGVEAF